MIGNTVATAAAAPAPAYVSVAGGSEQNVLTVKIDLLYPRRNICLLPRSQLFLHVVSLLWHNHDGMHRIHRILYSHIKRCLDYSMRMAKKQARFGISGKI